MKYLQLLLIALGLGLAVQSTVLAADAPADGKSGSETTDSDSAPDDGTEPECD